MLKFCIMAALKSELASSGKGVYQCDSMVQFVFNAENLEHATKRGSVITFDCDRFSLDEEHSSKNWRDAFNFNEEPPRGMIITTNTDYTSGIVMPYVVS